MHIEEQLKKFSKSKKISSDELSPKKFAKLAKTLDKGFKETLRMWPENLVVGSIMAELRPYNPSLRERTKQNIAGALTNLGIDNYMARATARGFTGSTQDQTLIWQKHLVF